MKISKPPKELEKLLQQVLDDLEARKDEDVEEWADRLAESVCGLTD